MKAWPQVPLGDVLSHRKEFIQIDDALPYKRCRVQLHAQGIVLRDEVPGIEIKTKAQQVCHGREFLVAEIDAKVGGFGIVPASLDGAIVSSHYFLFTVDPAFLDVRFLGYYVKTAAFRDQVRAQGSTNYAAIRPSHVLAYTVPLPSLEEQRRIVGRIETLAVKCELAGRLRVAADRQAANILDSHIQASFSEGHQGNWKQYVLGDFVTEVRYGTSEKTSDDTSGTPVLRMGNIQNGELVTSDLKYLHLSDSEKKTLLLKTGDIVVNRTNSAELVGKCAVFRLEGDFAYASYLIRLRIDTKRTIPELLAAYINSSAGRAYMFAERKQMTGQANVNAEKLKMLPIKLPGLDEQIELLTGIEQVRSFCKRIRAEQDLVGRELGAILPSILNQAFTGQL